MICLRSMDSPTKLTVSSPLSRGPSDSALLPPAPSPAPAVSVSALFGDDSVQQQAAKPAATVSAASLFQPELLSAGATQAARPSREAMFQSGGAAEESTPSDGAHSIAARCEM